MNTVKRYETCPIKKREEYANSEKYKTWLRTYDRGINKAYKDLQSGKITVEQYDEIDKKLFSQRPKKDFEDVGDWAWVSGKGYVNRYIEKAGKSLTIARLRDLGFNEKSAKEITERLLLKKLTLATV